jgi:hypothetical protein
MKPFIRRSQLMSWICWSVDSVEMDDWMMLGNSCLVL